MRVILFDLGNTLVGTGDHPLPGAVELLMALGDLRDAEGAIVPIGLVSDYLPPTPEIGIEARKQEYYARLRASGLARFFEPLERHVTLSTEIGFAKPDHRIFRAAVKRLLPGAGLADAVFVTEDREHVRAARDLGMMAVRVTAPGEPVGEVEHLADLIPILRRRVSGA
jgi:FMN phosphatase YigB (HAD superfamily)